VPEEKDTKYMPAPGGLWVLSDHVLYYFDLDGRAPLAMKRPLSVLTNQPPCQHDDAYYGRVCSQGFQPKETDAFVSEAGELLIVETALEEYPYHTDLHKTDQVWPSTLTIMAPNGSIIVRKPYSWMKTKWQWFWAEGGGSQNPLGLPGDTGLVRTRYETRGMGGGELFASRGSDFLTFHGRGETVIQRRNRTYELVWKRTLQNFVGELVASPTWATPILFHDSMCYRFSTVSESGSHKSEATINIIEIAREQDRTQLKRPRFAIGQSVESDWLLIAY
jgi:hypothetical protein